MTKYPYTTRPAEIPLLLQKIGTAKIPRTKVEASFFKTTGFSLSSSKYFVEILKKLGFINSQGKPSEIWQAYVADCEKSRLILASAIKSAYKEVFKASLCPYLEEDEALTEILQHEEGKTTSKNMRLLLDTFRTLNELADFQDMLCVEAPVEVLSTTTEDLTAKVKVNPNLQLNIQIHIDPNTTEEKIEAIFKNMRRYLLNKEGI